MTITCSEWIRMEKVNQLYELIKAYNGRTHNWYTAMPTYARDRVYLTYSFECMGMYNLFSEDWNRLNTNIVEKTRKKSWRATLRNFWSRHF